MSGGSFSGVEQISRLLARMGQQVASYDVFEFGAGVDLVSGVQVAFHFPIISDGAIVYLKVIIGSIEFCGGAERVVDFVSPFTYTALSFVMSVEGADFFENRFNDFTNESVKVFGNFSSGDRKQVRFIAIGSDE